MPAKIRDRKEIFQYQYPTSVINLLTALKPRRKNSRADFIAYAKVIATTDVPRDIRRLTDAFQAALKRLGGPKRFTLQQRTSIIDAQYVLFHAFREAAAMTGKKSDSDEGSASGAEPRGTGRQFPGAGGGAN